MEDHPMIGDTYYVPHLWNKERLEHLTSLIETLDAVLLSLQSVEKTNQVDKQISTIEKRIEVIKSQVSSVSEKITASEVLKEATKATLKLPNFGGKTDFKVEEAKLYCCHFNNDNKVTLHEFWTKIFTFTELQQLTENSCKGLLGCLLEKEPYVTFFNNRQKPLKEILSILVDRYDNVDSLTDYTTQLESLHRRDSESLSSVLSRAAELIYKTEIIVPEADRASRKRNLMKSYLLNFCSENAKKVLRYKQLLANKNGFILSYDDMLDICKVVEQDEKAK